MRCSSHPDGHILLAIPPPNACSAIRGMHSPHSAFEDYPAAACRASYGGKRKITPNTPPAAQWAPSSKSLALRQDGGESLRTCVQPSKRGVLATCTTSPTQTGQTGFGGGAGVRPKASSPPSRRLWWCWTPMTGGLRQPGFLPVFRSRKRKR